MFLTWSLDRPSRFEAQADAVSLLFSAKTQANPESSVGLLSMGGKGPEVLVTLTTDFGKILEGIHRTKIRGSTHLATGIQIAGVSILFRDGQLARMTARLEGAMLIIGSGTACTKAPTEQSTTATDHRLLLLTDRGG